jgi:calcineurin-like phosphoesterase family protein
MSNVWFTSDWHIGHKNILKYRDGFQSTDEHDATLIENYQSLISKRDIVYFLGDMVFYNRRSGKT